MGSGGSKSSNPLQPKQVTTPKTIQVKSSADSEVKTKSSAQTPTGTRNETTKSAASRRSINTSTPVTAETPNDIIKSANSRRSINSTTPTTRETTTNGVKSATSRRSVKATTPVTTNNIVTSANSRRGVNPSTHTTLEVTHDVVKSATSRNNAQLITDETTEIKERVQSGSYTNDTAQPTTNKATGANKSANFFLGDSDLENVSNHDQNLSASRGHLDKDAPSGKNDVVEDKDTAPRISDIGTDDDTLSGGGDSNVAQDTDGLPSSIPSPTPVSGRSGDATPVHIPVSPVHNFNVNESQTVSLASNTKTSKDSTNKPQYSKDTEYQRRWYHNENPEDLTINIVAFDLPKDNDHTQEEPLAYRDSNGIIRLYQPGQEPTVLVKEYSFDEFTGQTGWRHRDTDYAEHEPEVEEPRRSDHRRLDVTSVIREETGEHELETDKESTDIEESGKKSVDVEPSRSSPDETDDDFTRPEEIPGPHPPKKSRLEMIPDENKFVELDLHAIQAPTVMKKNLSQLVLYLTEVAYSPLELIRTFYMWITHNINYDTGTFFGRTKPRTTDPYSVLKSRLTLCEGYAKLFEALCREVGIHAVTIIGVVKGYGYQPSDDIFHEKHSAHAWNAVLLDSDWFLIDTTWGAGFVKTKERKYVARFNNVYFLTDPDVFITDHFPLRAGRSQTDVDRWQLLEKPVSKGKFKAMVNFEKHGKEWKIKAVSHKKNIIQGVQDEVDVILTETQIPMRDYVAFLYKGDQKLEQFTYTYKPDTKTVIIHVCMPSFGHFELQVYGRRKMDTKDVDFQPLVKYTISCTGSPPKDLLPYPSHHTCFGPAEDLSLFGVISCGDVRQKATRGEVTLPVQVTQFVDIVPRLSYEDYTTILHEYCFLNYSEDYSFLNLNVRLPYKGYYKLMLFGKKNDTDPTLQPFMTYIIDSRTGSMSDAFPVQLEHAHRNKCCLVQPLTKILPADGHVVFALKSPILQMVKCNDTLLENTGEQFEGVVRMPSMASDVILYGAESKEDFFHPLFTFKTV